MVSIIILSYNTKDLLISCLKSISKRLKDFDFEVIIVDNASNDGTIKSIQSGQFGQQNLKVIVNKENVGYSKGNNIGARTAKGNYLLFLNSDTQLRDNGLKYLEQFFKINKSVGIVGGRLLNEDGSHQLSTGKFYGVLNTVLMLFGGERFVRSSPRKIEKVDWVSGACLMVRKELFERLKGFDEHFFMYIEDIELCYRAKKIGYEVYFYPDFTVLHKGEGSSDKTFAIVQIYKNTLYFYKKHKSFLEYILVKWMLVGKAIAAILFGKLSHNELLITRYKKSLTF